jgi:hypothetical protein
MSDRMRSSVRTDARKGDGAVDGAPEVAAPDGGATAVDPPGPAKSPATATQGRGAGTADRSAAADRRHAGDHSGQSAVRGLRRRCRIVGTVPGPRRRRPGAFRPAVQPSGAPAGCSGGSAAGGRTVRGNAPAAAFRVARRPGG